MMKTVQKGFTLIELMIVVAIIGILAAVAIPAYQDYITRAQVTEAIELLGGFKTPFTEFQADKGHWPTSVTAIGVGGSVEGSVAGKYAGTTAATQVAINTGAGVAGNLILTVGMTAGRAAGTTLAIGTAGDGVWACGEANNGAAGGVVAAASNILNKYLPGSCKP